MERLDLPERSPTTTAGDPSRLATFGEEGAIGSLASGRVSAHVWLAAKPESCAISEAEEAAAVAAALRFGCGG
jgi:hypothetical protein